MVANDLLAALLRVESKGQNPFFSEHGDVAYQIKGNVACNNIVANIFTHSTHPSHTILGVGSKGQTSHFQNMVMLHIK